MSKEEEMQSKENFAAEFLKDYDAALAKNLIPDIRNLCPLCFGTGTVRMMQAAKFLNGPVVRTADKVLTCPVCSGTGYRKER